MKELNILYATDSNYSPHAAASVYSLLDNNRSFDKINIYIIDDNISDDCKYKFNSMVGQFSNATLIFYPFENLSHKLRLKETWFARAGYARLMLAAIADVDKMLYLDCDTIVNGSLEEIWGIDISDCCVAGVQDNPALFMSEVIGMDANDRYINSGVMLINLKKWREENIEAKIIKMIEDYNGFVPHHDQGIINGVCKGMIKIIHPKFNTMSQFFYLKSKQIKKLYKMKNFYSQEELDSATANPTIIHYISKFYNRPWFKKCTHPMKDLYVKYLECTPFGLVLQDGDLKRSVRIRRFVFNNFPFCIYTLFERVLNIRRKCACKK